MGQKKAIKHDNNREVPRYQQTRHRGNRGYVAKGAGVNKGLSSVNLTGHDFDTLLRINRSASRT